MAGFGTALVGPSWPPWSRPENSTSPGRHFLPLQTYPEIRTQNTPESSFPVSRGCFGSMLSGPLFPLQNALPALWRFPFYHQRGVLGVKNDLLADMSGPTPVVDPGVRDVKQAMLARKPQGNTVLDPSGSGLLGRSGSSWAPSEGPWPSQRPKTAPGGHGRTHSQGRPRGPDVKHARMGRELSGHTVLDMGGVGLLGRSGWSWSGVGGGLGGGGGGRTPQKRSLCRKKFRPKKGQFRKCKTDNP